MVFPAAPTESGTAKIHFLTTDGNVAAGWAGIITGVTTTGTNTVGWAGIATHVEGNAPLDPGSLGTLGAAPVVLVAGDDGSFVVPLQLNGAGDLKITLDTEAVVLGTGSAAIGKLAANSGVDIGNVDVASVPAPLSTTGGGVQASALRVTLASDSTGQVTIAGSTTGASAVQNQGASASGFAKAGNPTQVGGVYNATPPTVSTGQTVEAQSTARD